MKNKTNANQLSRRKMLQGSAATMASIAIVPRYVLGGPGQTPPSEILNVACVGVGGRGLQNTQSVMGNADVRIVALCDPMRQADYSQYYYKVPAGLEPTMEKVDEHYKEKKASGEYKGYKTFKDYRLMLEQEKAIDAVVVSTPDHAHAAVTMAAIKMGKHVYCEKPLTHTIEEARKITLAAREAKVATQMGNQGHSGDGIRLTCEWIWDGAIGDIREVHGWSHTGGGWSRQYNGARPEGTSSAPDTLDWDLWLGPIPHRPYHRAYAPYDWRGWWQFGTGAVGDMACHNLDPAFWALKLGYPETIEATAELVSDETTPLASVMRYQFPARGDMPPVKMTWYAGGLMPARPADLEPGRRWFDKTNGILFVGENGSIVCDGWGGTPRIIPETKMKAYDLPKTETIRRVKDGDHHRDWVDACKGGEPASSNFDYSGPLTETVLLGNVALRVGKQIIWDGKNMKATNAPEADQYIKSQYRNGFTL